MITIVDYGVGNLGSIANMLRRTGADIEVSSDPAIIAKSDKVVLPGVGAFDAAMRRIDAAGVRDALDECAVQRKVPILGICLGMQLLTNGSEEGELPGLGWIEAEAVSFRGRIDAALKVPHMGWNDVALAAASPLTRGFEALEEPRFYFAHSYFVATRQPDEQVLATNYGTIFTAAIQKENVFGVQFHPEKSHRFGLKLLDNFASL